MNEWRKCNFCYWKDADWGCEGPCVDYDGYKPVADKLIEKAHEKNISVQDVIALINLMEK